MKLSIIKIAIVPMLVSGLLLQSCKKQKDMVVTEQTDFTNSAVAQVYVATVNASRNYVYVDGNPVSGALLTSGALFPASGPGFKVSPGIKAFLVRDTLTATTQVPLSFAENMQFGKHYTVFMYDTITAPKQKTVEDNIVAITDTSARIRFANFVFSKVEIPAVDIYSARRKANIATNVQITGVTNFIPYETNVSDTFTIRHTGTTTDLMNTGVTTPIRVILTPREKRYYTLVFRGSYTTIANASAQARNLGLFVSY
jgi:hypothetical protein